MSHKKPADVRLRIYSGSTVLAEEHVDAFISENRVFSTEGDARIGWANDRAWPVFVNRATIAVDLDGSGEYVESPIVISAKGGILVTPPTGVDIKLDEPMVWFQGGAP